MATPGTCTRKFPGDRLCGKRTLDTAGMYIAVNKDAYLADLCPACESELLLTYLSGAIEVKWLTRPPEVVEDGSVWETGEIRLALVWAGFAALAGTSGPLNRRARSKFDYLLAVFPDLRQRVRNGEVFSEAEMELIRQRVAENRGA